MLEFLIQVGPSAMALFAKEKMHVQFLLGEKANLMFCFGHSFCNYWVQIN